ncbi:CxC2 domain-containing protein [Mycena kentingensis (nom. inval.)]|nr:CxC2 domain-containing protein [Mycena kentingensis (nom. inval.)]
MGEADYNSEVEEDRWITLQLFRRVKTLSAFIHAKIPSHILPRMEFAAESVVDDNLLAGAKRLAASAPGSPKTTAQYKAVEEVYLVQSMAYAALTVLRQLKGNSPYSMHLPNALVFHGARPTLRSQTAYPELGDFTVAWERKSSAPLGRRRGRGGGRAGDFVDGRAQRSGDSVMHLSRDRRRVTNSVHTASSSKRARTVSPEREEEREEAGWIDITPGDGGSVDGDLDDVVFHQIVAEPKPRRKTYKSDDPMRMWRPHQQAFLDELVRGEGFGNHYDSQHICTRCDSVDGPFYRCTQCGRGAMCQSCLKLTHFDRPLHQVRTWNGDWWEPCAPFAEGSELGMVYQLGHCGRTCNAPEPPQHEPPRKLVVLHVCGVFKILFRYCGCSDSIRYKYGRISQLMGKGWYPATVTSPRTCATYEALDLFRLLRVVGNTSAHDFVGTLERLTDATFTSKVPAFSWMSRQYDFLTRAKRAGRAHAGPRGLEETEAGGMAVRCLACPDPGRNMPEGWEDAPPGRIDYDGLRVSGVAGCVCARHGVVRPLGLGDLQKGERYANMDFVFMSAVGASQVKRIIVSYDVVCQWRKRLHQRVEQLEDSSEIKTILSQYDLQFGLPVWHAKVHEEKCRTALSLTFVVGVGRTDGEGIERLWAVINPILYATKEMGAGHRLDTVEGKLDHINEEKNATLGALLRFCRAYNNDTLGDSLQRKELLAVSESAKAKTEFEVLDGSIALEQREDWARRVDVWNADATLTNPYLLAETQAAPTEAQVLAELKKTELEEIRAGRGRVWEGTVTVAAFIKAGLELEHQQRRIKWDASATPISAERASQLDELRISMLKKIRIFEGHRGTFMPGVEELRMEEEERVADCGPPSAKETKLWLPSHLTEDERSWACVEGLPDVEARLREAQCEGALINIRGRLFARTHIIVYRDANSTGQRAGTRSATLLERMKTQLEREVARYREGLGALQRLKGDSYRPELRILRDEDLRVPGNDEPDAAARAALGRIGASHRVCNEPSAQARVAAVSWIWGTRTADENDRALHDSIRVEWCKARARRDRWAEEVGLIREEEKRVLLGLEHCVKEWMDRAASPREDADPGLSGALRAYALRQAELLRRRRRFFEVSWGMDVAQALREVSGGQDDDDEEIEAAEEAAAAVGAGLQQVLLYTQVFLSSIPLPAASDTAADPETWSRAGSIASSTTSDATYDSEFSSDNDSPAVCLRRAQVQQERREAVLVRLRTPRQQREAELAEALERRVRAAEAGDVDDVDDGLDDVADVRELALEIAAERQRTRNEPRAAGVLAGVRVAETIAREAAWREDARRQAFAERFASPEVQALAPGGNATAAWDSFSAYLTDVRPPPSPDDRRPDHCCAVCGELLSHPVFTSCLHIFCFVCLRGALQFRLDCPLCRKRQTSAPMPSSGFNNIFGGLCVDLYGWRDESEVSIEYKQLPPLGGGSLPRV